MVELEKMIDDFISETQSVEDLESESLREFMGFIFLLNIRWYSFSNLELPNNYHEENTIEDIHKKIYEELTPCTSFDKKNKGKDKKHIVRDIICYMDKKLKKFPLFFNKEKLNYCYLKPIISAIIYNSVLIDKKILKLVKDDYILDYTNFISHIEDIENYCEEYIKNSNDYDDRDIIFIKYIIELLWSKNKIRAFQTSFDISSKNKIENTKLKLIDNNDIVDFLKDTYYLPSNIFEIYTDKLLSLKCYNIFFRRTVSNLREFFVDFLEYAMQVFLGEIEIDKELKNTTSIALSKIERNNLFLETFANKSIDVLSFQEKYLRLQCAKEVMGFFDDFVIMEQVINGNVDIVTHIKSIIPITDLSKNDSKYIVSLFSNLQKRINKLKKMVEKDEITDNYANEKISEYLMDEYLSFFEEYKDELSVLDLNNENIKLELLCENIGNEKEKERKIRAKILKYINEIDSIEGIFKYSCISEYVFNNENIKNISWRQIYAEIDSIEIICENIVCNSSVKNYILDINWSVKYLRKAEKLDSLYHHLVYLCETFDFSGGMNIYLKDADVLKNNLISLIKKNLAIEYFSDCINVPNVLKFNNFEDENSMVYMSFMNKSKINFNEDTKEECIFYDFINHYGEECKNTENKFQLDIFKTFFIKTNESSIKEILQYLLSGSEYAEQDDSFQDLILLSKARVNKKFLYHKI